jgi:hypothetical protein
MGEKCTNLLLAAKGLLEAHADGMITIDDWDLLEMAVEEIDGPRANPDAEDA